MLFHTCITFRTYVRTRGMLGKPGQLHGEVVTLNNLTACLSQSTCISDLPSLEHAETSTLNAS